MKKRQKAPKPPIDSKEIPSSEANTTSKDAPSKWIRIDRPLELPANVKQALDVLDDAGHIAYVVGGSVRDSLLKRVTKDHDIATSATPDQIEDLFPNAVLVGKQFGVIKIPVEEGEMIEIATFRKDLDYEDYRRPKGILIAGPTEDARRRDFTVNALFYDPKTFRILDTENGVDDLRAKVIRAIGDPQARFKEDALRLIRAVRLACALDFHLDPETEAALKERARLIQKVSAERIRDELTLMWKGPHPERAMEMMRAMGLLHYVLPELEALQGVEQSPLYHPEGDVWKHTAKLMGLLAAQNPKRTSTLAWGALLHDIGKPIAARRSQEKNFNGHEIDGSKIAQTIGTRLKMPSAEIATIRKLIEDHLKFKDVFQMREATLQRFIREPHFEELLALHRADACASDGNLANYEFCESRLKELRNAPPESQVKLISGSDLIQLGFKPGPKFSEILRTVEDLTMEKKLASKDEALEYVVKHFVR